MASILPDFASFIRATCYLLGILLAYVGTKLMRTIDHYETEVLLTLALVLGGYSIAHYFHFSGPLAMVFTGLLIGGERGLAAMSETTRDYMLKFWEMMDEIFNAALFLLIGLELIIIPFRPEFIILGLISVVIVLLIRFIGLAIPTYLLQSSESFNPKALPVLTWGGLKGGIPIALALSISQEQGRDLIVAVTYIIVFFSILGQGLSMGKVINRYRRELS